LELYFQENINTIFNLIFFGGKMFNQTTYVRVDLEFISNEGNRTYYHYVPMDVSLKNSDQNLVNDLFTKSRDPAYKTYRNNATLFTIKKSFGNEEKYVN
jgi:hypothetical protein